MDEKQLRLFMMGGGVFLLCAIAIFFSVGWVAALPMALGGVAMIVIASQTTPSAAAADDSDPDLPI